MPRPDAIVPALLLLLTTVGCAGTGGTSRYATELKTLEQDCAARGGILTPIGGGTSGRPQTDYACRINDGGSLLRN